MDVWQAPNGRFHGCMAGCIPLKHINPFSTNVPLLYPLKTSENLQFSDVFRGYRSGTLVENELKKLDLYLGNNNSPLEIKYHQLAYYLKFYINQDAWHPDLLVQGSFQHKAFMAKIEKQVSFYMLSADCFKYF